MLIGARDEERDAVAGREDGQRVRPDLVRGVAVGGDPVRPDEDDVDLAAGHEVAGGDVRDERVRDAGLGQLPGGQPRALEVRPGLVDPDVDGAAGVVGRLDDPEGRPELAARERPGVAVGRIRSGRSSGTRQGVEAERGEPAVVVGRLEDDRVGLGADRGGDRVAVLGQVADGLVARPSPARPPSAG